MSFTDADPGGQTSDYSASIAWGDGTSSSGTVTPGSSGGFDVGASHSYAEEGSFPVKIAISDVGGSSTSTSLSVSVVDAALHASGTPQSMATTNVSTGLRQVASFTDDDSAGAASDYAATIVWGDGSSSAGTITGSGSSFGVDGEHSYATAGTKTITISVADNGGAGITTTTEIVVVSGPPPPPPTPSFASAFASGSTGFVVVQCQGEAGQMCSGSIVMTSKATKRHGSVVAVAARGSRHRAKTRSTTKAIIVGTSSFRVMAGQVAKVAVSLNSTGRRLLSRFYRLPVSVSVGRSAEATEMTFAYPKISVIAGNQFTAYSGGYTTFDLLALQSLPSGSRVTIRCSGAGCPSTGRVFKPQSHRLTVSRPLGRSRLQPGSTVEVLTTASNRVGEVEIYKIVSGRLPTVSHLCLPPGARVPQRCVV